MSKKDERVTRQVRIDNIDARFIEFVISVESDGRTFAEIIKEALHDKHPQLWETFKSVLEEHGEDISD